MVATDNLQRLIEKVNQNPDGISGVDAVFQLDLSSGAYQIYFHEGRAEYQSGTPWKAACTLEMEDKDFAKLLEGKLNPTVAFMSGRITVKGDLSKALQLQSILKKYT